MIGAAAQDAFISSQRWAVVTTLRRDGSPASSVVFFARMGDELLFSTTMDRFKAKSVQRDPRITLVVLDEGAPFRFVSIEGTATLDHDNLVANHVFINRAMRNDPSWSAPDGMLEKLQHDRRVIVRIRAERVSGVVDRS